MKTNKHHPDRHIIHALIKTQQTSPINWTSNETEMLIKAIIKYGKDYEKITNALKNRTQKQVQSRVHVMLRQITSDPIHENAKYAKILKKLPRTVPHVWTDQQKKKFNEALQKYGSSYKDIVKCFPTMTYRQITHHGIHLKESIEKNKNHPDAHLKKLLDEGSPNFYWT